LWDESLAADKNHSPLSAWSAINDRWQLHPCDESPPGRPEVSRLTNYVVLWPFQALHHRLSRTRTREVSQSKGRTREQPRPVVLAASRGTASANREPTIFFSCLISARSRPAIRLINEVLIPSFDFFLLFVQDWITFILKTLPLLLLNIFNCYCIFNFCSQNFFFIVNNFLFL
jgi:hypothetical protein